MGLGSELVTACGVRHEIDLVARYSDTLAIAELKNRPGCSPGKSKQMLHPRLMLSSATQVVFQAAQLGKTLIDADVVNAAMDTKAVIETTDVTEGIDGAM